MKKFLGLLIVLMIIASKCLAMTLSNPVEIGSFGENMIVGGVSITGASYISEQPKNIHNRYVYSKGVARFGNGDDAIYVHYGISGAENYKVGSQDVKNTVPLKLFWITVFKINVDNEHVMYFLRRDNTIPEIHYQYILIGRTPSGTWVKYFDTEELCKKYMGNASSVAIQKITLSANMIIADYARCNYASDHNFYADRINERGQLRFKWDEAAQWFGVEHVVY